MARDDFNLSDFLPYRLAVLSERVSKRLSLIYGEDHGLSIPEWRVIVHLSRCHEVSVREIHTCVNMEKPRVSRAVTRLATAGLVRKVASTDDHRLVKISLSEAGWKVLSAIVPDAVAVETSLMSAFTDSERDTFVALMEKLHAQLDSDPHAVRRSRMDTAD